jgi:hypothetical protein
MRTLCHVISIIALEGCQLRSADFLDHPVQCGEKSAHDRLLLQRGQRNGWALGAGVVGEMNTGDRIETVQELHALGLGGKGSSHLHHLGVVKLTRPETICGRGRARDLLPDPESLGHLLAILGGRAEVTPGAEV